MAKKESRGRSGGYEALRAAVKAGVPANLYIFYGEERYLLQNMVQQLKELLIPGGFEEFNYHRLGGKGLTVQELLSTPTGALALWLVFINAATFAVYGVDKRRARRGAWRVPEKTLFLLPLLGGSVGALLGMRTFRHKTKHWYFVWGIPLILLAQMALAVWLLAR